jgi:hypothetical protein
LSAPVTLPVTCLVCANVAENMHRTLQKTKSILFIRMMFGLFKKEVKVILK